MASGLISKGIDTHRRTPTASTRKPSAAIVLKQLPGTNAINAVDGVKKLMANVSKSFPQDLQYVVSLDTTEAVREGINEIMQTLFEAMVLVIIVVFIFLQGWRATLIPMIAVPVSLIGTFSVMYFFGYNLDNLSLMALTLSVAFVVDDAIVMLENIFRHIQIQDRVQFLVDH